MILQDRNELKEKLATIQEELTFVKRYVSQIQLEILVLLQTPN